MKIEFKKPFHFWSFIFWSYFLIIFKEFDISFSFEFLLRKTWERKRREKRRKIIFKKLYLFAYKKGWKDHFEEGGWLVIWERMKYINTKRWSGKIKRKGLRKKRGKLTHNNKKFLLFLIAMLFPSPFPFSPKNCSFHSIQNIFHQFFYVIRFSLFFFNGFWYEDWKMVGLEVFRIVCVLVVERKSKVWE